MSDRELLELAAKAGGIKGEYVDWNEEGDFHQKECITGLVVEINSDEYKTWNPLDDDGNNRMLSNKLELSIVFAEESDICWVTVFGAPYAWYDQFDAVQEAYPVSRVGQDAAVRRAVVRAAAEIGRNMP